MFEMYLNFDCDIIFGNIFEDLGNLFLKSVFLVNCFLLVMYVLVLEGIFVVVYSMVDRVDFVFLVFMLSILLGVMVVEN